MVSNDFHLPQIPPPVTRSYWVVEGKFLAGAYPGHADSEKHEKRIECLFDAGLRTFISLMEENETNNSGDPFRPYASVLKRLVANNSELELLRFPIPDTRIPSPKLMSEVLDAVDESLASNRPVYIHCFGGIGRTGTAVCCWLLRHGYASQTDVFDLLRKLRLADRERASWQSPENDEQNSFVSNWMEVPRLPLQVSPGNARDWFSMLTGFQEADSRSVRSGLRLEGTRLLSLVNGRTFECGQLEILSLKDLSSKAKESGNRRSSLKICETVGDVQALHLDPDNAGALFQVASQFNLLEMVGPSVTPEMGVTGYQSDRTQGPACAIACGASTIYRNYFVDIDGQTGQTAEKQVDCLKEIGDAFQNATAGLWTMQNGYCLPTDDGLQSIHESLISANEGELNELRSKLAVGVQWDAEVTLEGGGHLVSQVYCSALPISYARNTLPIEHWEPFARLVLDAAYEATLAAGILNAQQTGNNRVFLTLLGGGAFGNPEHWILEAVKRAVDLYSNADLDVRIVSYGTSNPTVAKLASEIG